MYTYNYIYTSRILEDYIYTYFYTQMHGELPQNSQTVQVGEFMIPEPARGTMIQVLSAR